MDAPARDPFGETPAPWWRTLFRPGKRHAPKRYATAAGALGPTAGLFLVSGDGLDKSTRVAIVTVLTLLPPWLVEVFWKRRKRLQEERILILPE